MTRHQNIWILIPVHNRRVMTRKCLEHLATLGLTTDYRICVIDDGCTDGTAEMLVTEFPMVHVVRGNGNLYWGGGTALGMETARAAAAEIFLWLNDDCLPAPGSIERLVQRVRTTRGICGGICFDPAEPAKITYAGMPLEPLPAHPHETDMPVPAESLNGNLVAVHHQVVEALGVVPAADFPHFGGDVAFTLRAHRAGLPVEIDPGARALNRRDDPLQRVLASRSPLRLWREMGRVASPLYFRTYWNMLQELFGWCAWFHWPAYFLRMLRLTIQMVVAKKAPENPRMPSLGSTR